MFYNVQSIDFKTKMNNNNKLKEGSQNVKTVVSPQNQTLHKITSPAQVNDSLNNSDSFADEDDYDIENNEMKFNYQNQIHLLTTKLNQANCESTKQAISYEMEIKQIKNKLMYYERSSQSLQAQKDQLFAELSKAKRDFAKDTAALKADVQAAYEGNRLTPNFNSQDGDIINELIKKEEIIVKLEKQLNILRSDQRESGESFGRDSLRKSENQLKINNFKEILEKKEKENVRLFKEIEKYRSELEKERVQNERILLELDENHLSAIKAKQKAIQQLRLQNNELNSTLDQLKRQVKVQSKTIEEYKLRMSDDNKGEKEQIKKYKELYQIREEKMKSLEASQHQLKSLEASQHQLQNKMIQMDIENSKLKSQKQSVEEYNKYLQLNNKETQQKKKHLQDQIYKLEKELSEQKVVIFNQRIQRKREITSIKQELDEQKVKHIYELQQKNKELSKLKEFTLSSNRQGIQFEELNQKHHNLLAEFDKISQLNNRFKVDNANLKEQIANLYERYDKMKEKYSGLQKQIRQEFEVRVKTLENEIYRQQQLNEDLKGLQSGDYSNRNENNYKSNRLVQNTNERNSTSGYESEIERLKNIIQIVGLQNNENKVLVEGLNAKNKELMEIKVQKEEHIKRLENEIRNIQTDHRNLQIVYDEINDNYKNFNTLELDIVKMNDQLKREKTHYEQKKQQFLFIQDKNNQKVATIQNEFENQRKVSYELRVKLSEVENELHKKNIQLSILKEEEQNVQTYKRSRQSSQNQEPQSDKQMRKQASDTQMRKEASDKQMRKQAHLVMDASKKNQFNGVLLENKLSEMQKEIQLLQLNKQKQIEDYKNVVRRQLEHQSKAENQRLKEYVRELEKKCQFIHDKIKQKNKIQNLEHSELINKITKVEAENYALKYDYSESLQEINMILLKYHSLEEKYKKNELNLERLINKEHELEDLKEKYNGVCNEKDYLQSQLNNASKQIEALNKVLMMKQYEINKNNKIKVAQQTLSYRTKTLQNCHVEEYAQKYEKQTQNHQSMRYYQKQSTKYHYEPEVDSSHYNINSPREKSHDQNHIYQQEYQGPASYLIDKNKLHIPLTNPLVHKI